MKPYFVLLLVLFLTATALAQGENEDPAFSTSPDLKISNTSVVFDDRLDQLIFTIEVEGTAGASIPSPAGQLDGAPVLGYAFPTTLSPTDVGFGPIAGIVALALTSHPDFDDTPLWDEDNDRNYLNDGAVWHPHWVVLRSDERVAGGLSVLQFNPETDEAILPPTNPGMPMYMDSPGHPIITKGQTIRVVVPAYRMNHKTVFNFDAVAAYMQVNGSIPNLPMLGVYAVYSIASGDLSLPF
ncbi:MAG: hypothetical protein AAF598_19535, partial [Bacteroidota bacterium]